MNHNNDEEISRYILFGIRWLNEPLAIFDNLETAKNYVKNSIQTYKNVHGNSVYTFKENSVLHGCMSYDIQEDILTKGIPLNPTLK